MARKATSSAPVRSCHSNPVASSFAGIPSSVAPSSALKVKTGQALSSLVLPSWKSAMLMPAKHESSNASMDPGFSGIRTRKVRLAWLAAPTDWATRPSCRKSMFAPQSTTSTRLPCSRSRFLSTAASPIAPEGSEMQRSPSHSTRIAWLTSALVTVSIRLRDWRQISNGRLPVVRTAVPSQKRSSCSRVTGFPASKAAFIDA